MKAGNLGPEFMLISTMINVQLVIDYKFLEGRLHSRYFDILPSVSVNCIKNYFWKINNLKIFLILLINGQETFTNNYKKRVIKMDLKL